MSIDPLAEKYSYNSTYAFQENKMGLGRELEGLELAPFVRVAFGTSDAIKLSTEVSTKVSETGGETTQISSKFEWHHLIPRALKDNELIRAARDEGFKFEGAENKVPLEKFSRATGRGQHGSHPKYNNALKEKLNAGPGEGVKPIEFVRNLATEIKEKIETNPQTKINDLLKTPAPTTITESTGVRKPELPKKLIPQKKEKSPPIPFEI